MWLKAAQEKEELQRKGDQLDADIRKAEKETRALENTVRLLNSRNQTYHRSLARVGETSKRFPHSFTSIVLVTFAVNSFPMLTGPNPKI